MVSKALVYPALVALFLSTACAAPAPGQPARSEDVEARSTGQGGINCELGKEHWRSSESPKRGGTIVFTGSGAEHMDVTAAGANKVEPQVYNSIVEYRGCFAEDMAVKPSLAKSWEVSPDGLIWTFKLRDDVRWHNKAPVYGRPFSSADVAWTIEHQKANGILGSTWRPMEHREPDAQTVVLDIKTPDPDFLVKVGHHQNLMVPREVKEQFGDFKRVAIGTGAFMMKEFRPGQDFLLERNPDYYEVGQDGKPLPYVDQVHAVVFADRAAHVAALRTGQLDMPNAFALPNQDDADNMRRSNPKLNYYRQLQPVVYGVWFNHKRAPWDNARLRKAVALAIDPDDVAASYGPEGAALRSGFLPPAFQEYAWTPEQHRERYRRDVEQAKRLVAEAGFGPGQLKSVFVSTPAYQQQAEIALEALKAIGLDARLEIVPNHISSMQQGNFDLAWGGQISRLYPGYWVGELFRTGSTLNTSGLSDPQTDQLIDAQAREMDPAARKQQLQQLQTRLYEITASVPVVTYYYQQFTSCRVRNWKPMNPTYNTSTVVAAWLDQTGC